MSTTFKDPAELGREIREFVKNSTRFKIQDLANILGIHPGNISKRLGRNNIKLHEIVTLAEHIQVPLVIKFGAIVAKNQFSEDLDTIEQLQKATETQAKLIQYMELAEARQAQIEVLKEEVATYSTRQE